MKQFIGGRKKRETMRRPVRPVPMRDDDDDDDDFRKKRELGVPLVDNLVSGLGGASKALVNPSHRVVVCPHNHSDMKYKSKATKLATSKSHKSRTNTKHLNNGKGVKKQMTTESKHWKKSIIDKYVDELHSRGMTSDQIDKESQIMVWLFHTTDGQHTDDPFIEDISDVDIDEYIR
ncbi:unnamed protein product, partial [Oppiella nova]